MYKLSISNPLLCSALATADSRTFRKVTIDTPVEADRVFTMLMGDEVPPRRDFIERNATYANIDA